MRLARGATMSIPPTPVSELANEPDSEQLRRWRLHQARLFHDPIYFFKYFWPDVTFYDKQWEMIWDVENTPEVYVVAGNKLGKDFCAAAITLRYFLIHHPVRIVTTSVKERHLKVLWGEMGRFIQTSAHPLTVDKGGPLIWNHMDLTKVVNGVKCPISYCWGMVSETEEGLSGHHAPWTLAVVDEASGVGNKAYSAMQGWAKRILAFGNPNQPAHGDSFFKSGVEGGNVIDPGSNPKQENRG